MPFRSEAQRRLFFAKRKRGEISKATLERWQEETRGRRLPRRVDSIENLSRLIRNRRKASKALSKAMESPSHHPSLLARRWEAYKAADMALKEARMVTRRKKTTKTRRRR